MRSIAHRLNGRRCRTSLILRSPSINSRLGYPSVRSAYTSAADSSLPKIAQPSIWNSIIPKALRTRSKKSTTQQTKKTTNPWTYFIWMYLLIGSQAIRILGVKNEYTEYKRKADLKLAQLRDVVERLQRGEEVDVEKALGTGDEAQEEEWEDALKELENEDRVWQKSRDQKRAEKEKLATEQADANPVNDGEDKVASTPADESSTTPLPPRTPGFF